MSCTRKPCFESHQAAEKAVKALLHSLGLERRGHSLLYLLREASHVGVNTPKDVTDCARLLDKHYIPSRYPDVFDEGAPTDYYTRSDGEACLRCARRIVDRVKQLVKGYL